MLCGKKQVTSYRSKGEKENLLRETSNTCKRVIVLTRFKVPSQEKYQVFFIQGDTKKRKLLKNPTKIEEIQEKNY